MPGFTAEDTKIRTLFAKDGFDKIFTVHPPQRRFKWKVKQIKQLWDDVTEAATEQPMYYLGPITIAPIDDNTITVIDGQQRIATISMLLSSIRNELFRVWDNVSDIGTKEEAKRFQETLDGLVSRYTDRGQRLGPVLILQKSDQESYAAYAVAHPNEQSYLKHSNPNPEFTEEGRNRIQDAMVCLDGLVRTYHADGSNDSHAEALMNLGEYCLQKLIFVMISTPGEAEQAVVFDRSNSRGLSLTTSEQVKSALMARAGRINASNAVQFLSKWDEMATRLDSVSEKTLDDFLRAFWLSTKGFLGKQAVYGALVALVDKRDGPKPLGLVNELNASSRTYLRLIRPQPTDIDYDDLRDFYRMGVVASLPLLMATKEKAPSEFGGLLKLVASLQVRNILVGTDQANKFEKRWSAWSLMVRAGNLAAAKSEIGSEIYDDDNFKARFAEASIKKNTDARYLLRKIEFHQINDRLPPVGIDVEHVLPQSVGRKLANDRIDRKRTAWIKDMGFNEPINKRNSLLIQQAVNRLGNQTLWHRTPNRSEKDSTFESKKVRYANPEENTIRMTADIATNDDWSIETISNRQKGFISKALKIWEKP